METPAASEATAPTPVPWGVPELGGSEKLLLDTVKNRVEVYIRLALDQHGGPAQYLRHKLDPPGMCEEFAEWLFKTFPPSNAALYHFTDPVPPVGPQGLGSTTPLVVHVAQLGFSQRCSMKPDPSAHAAGQIVEHILMQGFLTGEQPLRVKPVLLDSASIIPWAGQGFPLEKPWPAFGLGYSKGMLRATSLLSLLHMRMEDGGVESFLLTFPQVKDTVRKIYVHHVQYPSAQEEVFANFRMSLRGSIRKPPNLLAPRAASEASRSSRGSRLASRPRFPRRHRRATPR